MNKSESSCSETYEEPIDENKDMILLLKDSYKKTEDNYTKIRKTVEEKVPDKYDKYIEFIFILPDIITLFYRIFRDTRVSFKVKLVVGTALTYLAFPLDIFPDFIPFVGKIDDISLAFFVLNRVLTEVPLNVLVENWQGDYELIVKIKSGITYINKLIGGTKIDKALKTIEKIYNAVKEEENE